MLDIMYYLFCALCLGGGLGMILMPNYVNATMSMLVSMLGVAGLLLMMEAYFLAFIMIMVYDGAVLVLFIFVVMIIGDKPDGISIFRRLALLGLWIAIALVVGICMPSIFQDCADQPMIADNATTAVSVAKNYGLSLFTTFMLPFQIAGVLLLSAMVGVMVIAKPKTLKNRNVKTLV